MAAIEPFVVRDPECEVCGSQKLGLRYTLSEPPPEWTCDTCSYHHGAQSSHVMMADDLLVEEDNSERPWTCGMCTFENGPITLACEICGAARPHQDRSPIGAVVVDDLKSPPEELLPVEPEDGDPYALFVAPTPPVLPPGYMDRVVSRLLKHKVDSGQLVVTPQVILKFEEYVRREMSLGSFTLPKDWIFQTPPAVVDKVSDRIIRSQSLLKEIYTLHIKEEKLMTKTPCQKCKRFRNQAFLLNPVVCQHLHCIACYRDYVHGLMDTDKCNSVRCPSAGCPKELPIAIIQRVLSADAWQRFEELALNGMLKADSTTRLLNCPNPRCENVMSVALAKDMPVPPKIVETDDMGQLLSQEAWVHFNQNRIRCPSCQTNFCADCNLSPYHKGFTCESLQRHQKARKCRFCDIELPALDEQELKRLGRPPAFTDVCTEDEECQAKMKLCCPEMLPCGHPCAGTTNHGPRNHVCLVCEHEKAGGPPPDDLCAICFVEELQAAPVVKLHCRHLYHYDCLREKLERKWPGRRITFGFAQCPTCKRMIECEALQKEMSEVQALHQDVLARARERLKLEGLEKDPKLTSPSSQFYQQPDEFAMSSFAFYPCFKCSKVYFGGRRNCEANADAERAPADEFICYDCSEVKIVPCTRNHPVDQLCWKCRFCCMPALWFCWGTTRFCERCHNQPGSNIVYPCPGPEQCPLKIKHPENSALATSEFSLGCGLCQQLELMSEKPEK